MIVISKLIFAGLLGFASIPAMAQTYNAKFSKDSLGILNTRVEVLKMSMKVLELKLKKRKKRLM